MTIPESLGEALLAKEQVWRANQSPNAIAKGDLFCLKLSTKDTKGHKEFSKEAHVGNLLTLVFFVLFVDSFRQNKSPFAIALGDWFLLQTCFLASQASPNDSGIVIIVVIIISEAKPDIHIGGIIARHYQFWKLN